MVFGSLVDELAPPAVVVGDAADATLNAGGVFLLDDEHDPMLPMDFESLELETPSSPTSRAAVAALAEDWASWCPAPGSATLNGAAAAAGGEAAAQAVTTATASPAPAAASLFGGSAAAHLHVASHPHTHFMRQALAYDEEEEDDEDEDEEAGNGGDGAAHRRRAAIEAAAAAARLAPRNCTSSTGSSNGSAHGAASFFDDESDEEGSDSGMDLEGDSPQIYMSAAPPLPQGQPLSGAALAATPSGAARASRGGSAVPSMRAPRGLGSAAARRAAAREPIPDRLEDLSDTQLATVDFKILMRLMERAGLTEDDISEVKAKRRRLKNRLSARVCSNKKREKCSELEDTNKVLVAELSQLKLENRRLHEETNKLQESNAVMHKNAYEASHENAQLRAQVAHLTQLLVNAGVLSTADTAAIAA